MIVQKFILAIGCLVVSVNTEEACNRWMQHKNFHLLPSQDDCGKVKINQETSSRIFNGKDAARGSLPWMAVIKITYGEGHLEEKYCGGSVINKNYVLTAAHCIYKIRNPISFVAVGAFDKYCAFENLCDMTAKLYLVTKYIKHPQYFPGALINDIALLRLDSRISFDNPLVNTICLPIACELAGMDFLGEWLTMGGWGDTSSDSLGNTIKKTKLRVAQCTDYRVEGTLYTPVPESQMCTEATKSVTCGGDDGGALVYEYKLRENFVQVGVLSLSPGNCSAIDSSEGVLDQYSKVSHFMDWILDSLEP